VGLRAHINFKEIKNMKSDVKAVRVTGTGAVFAGRTRLRGLIMASDGGGAGVLTLQDNTDSTTLFQGDCPNGDVFAFNIPEDGVVFPGGMKVSAITNLTAATLLIDK
jgi:hypothetical protein|tara:strand:- start:320 stop:640 length:321 start_codon:yes stop_codon:yes gene_type:complete